MKKLKNGLWDLDGVFFCLTQRLREAFAEANAKTIRKFIDPGLSHEEARERVAYYHKHYSDIITGMDSGVAPEKRHEMYRFLYRQLDHSLIQRQEALVDTFNRSVSEGMRHGVLTHSNSDWCSRVLGRVSLRHVFRPVSRITSDKVDCLRKHANPEVFQMALERLKFDPEETFFVDDSPKNLRFAHELGLYTIWKSDRQMDVRPDYINSQCPDIPAIFEHVKKVNQSYPNVDIA